jgi:hypothetical protein
MSTGSTQYPQQVNLIADGEPVKAETPNRPLSELAARTEALREILENAQFGSAVIKFNVPVEAGAKVGMAVYLADDLIHRRGLATVALDANGLEYGVARSAFVSGMVLSKISDTRADVAAVGSIKLPGTTLAEACIGGTVHTGQLFLSGNASKAGYLTSLQPPVGVPVAIAAGPDADGNYTLDVLPCPRNVLENHVHHRISLTMAESTAADEPGWVDLSDTTLADAVFADMNIPTGAAYGYRVDQDAKLSTIWPPIPLQNVYLERNGDGVRIVGDAGEVTAVVNEDGIWWMSGCAGQVPFGQADINPGAGCVTYPDRLDLWISRLVFKTGEGMVTSLRPADDSIEITDLHGTTATGGDLKISAKLTASAVSGQKGYQAAKTVTGGQLKFGVVTEGIQSLSPFLTISGVPVDEAEGDPASGFTGGRVLIDWTDPNSNREGSLDVLQLDNVDVASPDDITSLIFRNGVAGTIRGRLRLPTLGVPEAGLVLRFKALVMAHAGGTLPDLSMTVRRIPQPTADCEKQTLPTPDDSFPDLTLSSCGTVTSNQYLQKSSEGLTVQAGDLVFASISRGSGDGYAGDLGVLDLRYSLSDLPESSSSSSSSSS